MSGETIRVSEVLSSLIRRSAQDKKLDSYEKELLSGNVVDNILHDNPEWNDFVKKIKKIWDKFGYVVIKDIPIDNGISSLIAATAFGSSFKPYRDKKIVKHFKMSPWNKGLSHTLKEGFFHTDINTSKYPPALTFIHCKNADPSYGMGENRVVSFKDLISELKKDNNEYTAQFMLSTQVSMVDEKNQGSWEGTIVHNNQIRFHPETLRAAAKRLNKLPKDLEFHLSCIHETALKITSPIHLDKGDALIVSNHRQLHYRGSCTVKFTNFPNKYESRQIYVFHLMDEPKWEK